VYDGLIAAGGKGFGRYLSAEVAIDARAVDVKIARRVFGQPQIY
jgi:hypothetical protein